LGSDHPSSREFGKQKAVGGETERQTDDTGRRGRGERKGELTWEVGEALQLFTRLAR